MLLQFPSISLNTNPTLSQAPGFYTRISNSFGYLNKAVREFHHQRAMMRHAAMGMQQYTFGLLTALGRKFCCRPCP